MKQYGWFDYVYLGSPGRVNANVPMWYHKLNIIYKTWKGLECYKIWDMGCKRKTVPPFLHSYEQDRCRYVKSIQSRLVIAKGCKCNQESMSQTKFGTA